MFARAKGERRTGGRLYSTKKVDGMCGECFYGYRRFYLIFGVKMGAID